MKLLKALFSTEGSRKAQAMLIGGVVILFGSYFGIDEDTLQNFTYVILTYMGAQGLADFSKDKS